MMDEPPAAEAVAAPKRSPSVGWALRLTAVAALAGCAATQYLSRVSAPAQAARAQIARATVADPVTTGSIVHSARATALDPCAAPPLRR